MASEKFRSHAALRCIRPGFLAGVLLAAAGLLPFAAHASESNFEIVVHPSETAEEGKAETELHSNMAVSGTAQKTCGVLPNQHVLNESLEVVYGFTSWFETALYSAAAVQPGIDAQWVGERLFPRARAPESWGLPFGLGFGTAISYQRRAYSADTLTLDIVPIIDKKIGPWYFAANPEFVRSLNGKSTYRGFEFSPAFKASYDVAPKVALGFEYYSSFGPLQGFDPVRDQQHQLFGVIDIEPAPHWDLNFGVGAGLTGATDAFVIKMIIGRKF